MTGEEALEKQLEELRQVDKLTDLKCAVHDRLVDYYFEDQSPMVLDRQDPAKAEDLYKKVGEHMKRFFGE
tara:strand:+ start:288 stop:497 length:210 start_codon:yes stop_codon:yes gene_type:complete